MLQVRRARGKHRADSFAEPEDHQGREHRHPSSHGPVAGWNFFSLVVSLLQDKDARINKKKSATGKARASEKFLRQQRKKAREHAGSGTLGKDERQLHCLLDTDDENGQAFAALMRGLTLETEVGSNLGSLEDASLHSFEEHDAFMSEIQLRGIVDKMAREASSQDTCQRSRYRLLYCT